MKKIAVTLIAGVLALSGVACGGETEQINENQTQLFVTAFEGGYGVDWLKAIKTRFEAQYANVSFEEGKTGVQVIIKPERNLTQDSLDGR